MAQEDMWIQIAVGVLIGIFLLIVLFACIHKWRIEDTCCNKESAFCKRCCWCYDLKCCLPDNTGKPRCRCCRTLCDCKCAFFYPPQATDPETPV